MFNIIGWSIGCVWPIEDKGRSELIDEGSGRFGFHRTGINFICYHLDFCTKSWVIHTFLNICKVTNDPISPVCVPVPSWGVVRYLNMPQGVRKVVRWQSSGATARHPAQFKLCWEGWLLLWPRELLCGGFGGEHACWGALVYYSAWGPISLGCNMHPGAPGVWCVDWNSLQYPKSNITF